MEVMMLESGYSKPDWTGTLPFRAMTLEEVKTARGHIHLLDKNGKVRRAKVNGSAKTWKTRPGDVKLPYKYGQYEFGYVEFVDGSAVGTVAIVPVL